MTHTCLLAGVAFLGLAALSNDWRYWFQISNSWFTIAVITSLF